MFNCCIHNKDRMMSIPEDPSLNKYVFYADLLEHNDQVGPEKIVCGTPIDCNFNSFKNTFIQIVIFFLIMEVILLVYSIRRKLKKRRKVKKMEKLETSCVKDIMRKSTNKQIK